MTQTLLTCPICETSLTLSSNSLICNNNHCFDYSKEGYINLLPPQHKKTKDPGDNKEMIRCRKDFLQVGYYEFLAPEITSIISQFLPEKQDIEPIEKTKSCIYFLDSGCGEGYFTSHIKSIIESKSNYNIEYYGMDISKEAVKLAAKRNKEINWFVASSNNIPVANNSLDIVLKINAPLNFEKLKIRLSSNAIIISVSPGKNHLEKLRETMYLKPLVHKLEETPDGFTLLHQKEIEKQMTIPNQQDINNLFRMTPYYWNSSPLVKQKVAELNELKTTASFNINVYQRNQISNIEEDQ